MGDAAHGANDELEAARLLDEIEQLHTALEAKDDEIVRLVEDRDRLLGRVTTQARDLQSMSAAHAAARSQDRLEVDHDASVRLRSDQDQEELRVAFEEMQVLTE